MTDLDIIAIRSEFPVVEHCTYLNHAAVGPISRQVQQAVIERTHLHLEQPDRASAISAPIYQRGRDLAAQLVGARPERIAYIQNTSHGLSLVANGLPWRAGDNVIVPELEFPSNYLIWSGLSSRGVELREFPATGGRLLPEQLESLVDERTQVVTLSHVQFYNGFRSDLASFAEICRRHDALLVVDGTQSIGAIDLDIAATGVDVLVVSAHKWMLGPLGVGFMALSDRAFERVSVTSVGWLSVNDPFEFRRELDFLPDARRFEPGTENAAGMFGLTARLEQINEAGIDLIERYILSLTDRLVERLHAKGYEVTSPRGDGEKSGIVTFRDPKRPSEELFERLDEASIRVSLRAGGIRVSPHYYNTVDEIERVVEILED